MKKRSLITLSALIGLLLLSNGKLNAQWDGSTVNTYTTAPGSSGNLGIGIASTNAKIHTLNPEYFPNTNVQGYMNTDLKIERKRYMTTSWPIHYNSPNIFEIWKEDFINNTSSGNKLIVTVNTEGVMGINKTYPSSAYALDIGGSVNADDNVTVGGSGSVGGELVVGGYLKVHSGQVLGDVSTGALSLAGNTNASNGSAIQLFASNHSSLPGEMRFYSPNINSTAFMFLSYDVSNNAWNGIMKMNGDGKVVIGANVFSNTPGDYNLYVEKGILTERVRVALNTTSDWADHVFADHYDLLPLHKVESYISANKHLPGIPSAQQVVKEGVDIAKMEAKLLQKIEELTLYAIQQQKEIESQQKEINKLKKITH